MSLQAGLNKMIEKELIVIGGGPAGIAAAVKAKQEGTNEVLIIERDKDLGGVLQQYIHNGFGLTRFNENLTGPEYSAVFEEMAENLNIEILKESTVINLTEDKIVTVINADKGVFQIKAKAVILAMGCRERSKGALNISGTRPAGVLSAGTAQRYVNMQGLSVGKDVVILGSGDIGLIMARRMTLEGSKVHAVIELMPYSSGLKRNIVQCLNDYNIPLYLSHTITEIKGEGRLSEVTVSKVDSKKMPIKGSEFKIKCDTLLLSVGLIPENELTKKIKATISMKTKGAIVDQSRETNKNGVFACGNVLQVHDLVDFVSEEAEIAGKYASDYIKNGTRIKNHINIDNCDKTIYVLPQLIDLNMKDEFKLFFRVKAQFENAVVELSDKKTCEILYSRRKSILTPGEMETIKINSKILEKITGDIQLSIKVNA